MSLNQNPIFFQRLDTVGNGSGNSNMAVDGSTTPVTFKVTPSASQIIHITRILFYVKDTGAFDADKWGNGVVMATGLELKIKEGSIITSLSDPIKTSGELAGACFDIANHSFGTGDEILCARMTFAKMGQNISLDGSSGDEFQVIVNDDLTNINVQYITAQGNYVKA